MRNIYIRRLVAKGLSEEAVPAYIRNLHHTIFSKPHIGLYELNGRLRWLGWGEIELDRFTLELIMADE